MSCSSRIAAMVVASASALATAPGCQGVVLDLGPDDPGDPTCPEVVSGAELGGVSFGHHASGDCVRFFAQTAADLDKLMNGIDGDIASACDALAAAGGATVATSPELHARCDAAVAAISTGAPYTTMGPFTIRRITLGSCTPARRIPCGACGPPCSEDTSENARAICSVPVLDISPAQPPGADARSALALAALEANLPVLLGVASARGDPFLQTIRSLSASASSVLVNAHLDLRGVECMGRSEGLLTEANIEYSVAGAEANRIVDALSGVR